MKVATLALALLLVVMLTSSCGDGGEDAPSPDHPNVIVRSTIYETTAWAVANLLPGGRNLPFSGIPVPSMLGADSADMLLKDVVITALNEPVTVDVELILLNEKNIERLEYDGVLYDYYYTLNPEKRSFGKMTFVQTSPDDHGPGAEGFYTHETTIELIATLVPLNGGPEAVVPATITTGSPVPIQFSFDPPSNAVLKMGPVGDSTANWHTDKADYQKDFFGFPGFLQIPLAGRSQFDAGGFHATAGGAKAKVVAADQNGDFCPSDADKVEIGLAGCGNSDEDSNNNNLPDYFESFLVSGGAPNDDRASLAYDAETGEILLDLPADTELTAVNISSASGIFIEGHAENVDGSLDVDSDTNIFKATFGQTFGSLSFGSVAERGLSEEFILEDVTVRFLFSDGRSSGGADLIY